jgi:hypothetical protein
MQMVQRNGKPMPTEVKMDPEDLSTVWLVTPDFGMVKLSCVSRDTELYKYTLTDYVEFAEHLTLESDLSRDQRDQAAMDKVFRREGTSINADAERQAEIKVGGKKPSASQIRSKHPAITP